MHTVGQPVTRRATLEADSATGLYYYRARYYDPSTGRFVSEDPVRFLGSVSFYPYAQNHPTALVDPLGLKPGDHYPTPELAAINALNDIANTSMCEHWEYGGTLYKFPDGSYSYTPPAKGPWPDTPGHTEAPPGTNKCGSYHTHPCIHGRDPWGFSDGDDLDAFLNGPSYIVEPNGTILRQTPVPGAPKVPFKKGTITPIFGLKKLRCGCPEGKVP
jgi:RHS repeat-associated protein